MLRFKIYLTIFVIYEIVAIILLHDVYTCNAMFTSAFCADSAFKYFLFCAAIPLMVGVLLMWLDTILFHRRSFWHRAGDVVSDVASDVKSYVGRVIDMRDIDKYLAAAVIFGIKKYSDAHPHVRRAVQDIIDSANGNMDMNGYADDDTDYVYTDSVRRTTRTSSPNSTGRRTSATNGTTQRQRSTTTRRTANKR